MTIAKPIQFLLTAFVLRMLTSCSSVVYTTVGQNVPLFQEKGEVTFSGGIGETSRAGGINAQLAVAVSDHVAVMTSYYNLKSEEVGSGSYVEAGAGLFKRLSDQVTGEVFAGIGFGSHHNTTFSHPSGYSWDMNANYFKPFIQPSLGISTGSLELAFTPRIGFLSYTSHSDTYTNGTTMRAAIDDYFQSKQNSVVFEPGLTLRLGYRAVKVQAQYNHSSLNYSSPDFKPVDREFISLGIFVLISKRWRR